MFIVKTLENLDNFLITNPLLHFQKKVILWLDFMLRKKRALLLYIQLALALSRVPLTHFLASGPKFPPFIRETNTYVTGTL